VFCFPGVAQPRSRIYKTYGEKHRDCPGQSYALAKDIHGIGLDRGSNRAEMASHLILSSVPALALVMFSWSDRERTLALPWISEGRSGKLLFGG